MLRPFMPTQAVYTGVDLRIPRRRSLGVTDGEGEERVTVKREVSKFDPDPRLRIVLKWIRNTPELSFPILNGGNSRSPVASLADVSHRQNADGVDPTQLERENGIQTLCSNHSKRFGTITVDSYLWLLFASPVIRLTVGEE